MKLSGLAAEVGADHHCLLRCQPPDTSGRGGDADGLEWAQRRRHGEGVKVVLCSSPTTAPVLP